MILIIALLAVALLLLAVLLFFFRGLPDSRTAPAKRILWTLLAAGIMVIGAMGVAIAIQVQEKTGSVTWLSGGAESDARQWISRNSAQAPSANQPGDNIHVLREGLSFIRSHQSVANSPDANRIITSYGSLPERPTRLLSRQEEASYYEGARAVYSLIESVAAGSTAASSGFGDN